MMKIHKLKERLEALGCKCKFDPDFNNCIFKNDKRPEAPIEPKLPDSKNLTIDQMQKYEKELENYNARKLKYDALIAELDLLSNRPAYAEIIAVRDQVNIIDKLYHIINMLVPNPDADFFEDDYDAIVWRDARPKPAIEQVRANKITYLDSENAALVRLGKIRDIKKSCAEQAMAVDPEWNETSWKLYKQFGNAMDSNKLTKNQKDCIAIYQAAELQIQAL